MNKAKLILLACPSLLTSMLLVANPAHATKVVAQPTAIGSSEPDQPLFEVVFEQQTPESPMPALTDEEANAAIDPNDCGCSGETPMLNFTDEESNAAIKRFGCDCAGCLNALRELQGKPPLL